MKKQLTRGLVVALGAATLAGCQALQTVDRGLYQAAEQVSERDRVTGQRSLSLADRNAQIQQGNGYIKQLLEAEEKAGRKVNSALDAAQYERLVRVFDRIHQVSHLRQERWIPLLIERDSFNAFTTGGTYIVVHTELMKQLSDDNELAAVIGHEVAHTVANHLGESQSHQMASRLSGSKSAARKGYQAAFTHENEREADRVGVLYSALAGYDPAAGSKIWQRQYLQQGNARTLFAHDHPVNAERAAENRQVAERVRSYYTPGKQNARYAELLVNNNLWQQKADGPAAGEGGGLMAVLSTAAGAYMQHEQTKSEMRRQQQQSAFVKAVEQRMKLVSAEQLADGSLETRWQFQADNPPLKNLVMGLMIKNGKKVERVVAHIKGRVAPGQRFPAHFVLPESLKGADVKKLPTRFYVDDVEPSQ